MKTRLLYILCIFSLAFISSLNAAVYQWNAPAGGEMGDPAKWIPYGTPGSNDFADFLLPNSYTVYLANDAVHDRLRVDGSRITLNLNGYYYLVEGKYDSYAEMVGENQDSAMEIYGGFLDSADVHLCWNPGSVAQVDVHGQGTEWYVYSGEEWRGFFIADGGTADFSLRDQAELAHGYGFSANYPEDQATIEVSGQGTQWYVDGWFGMALEGGAWMTLSDGAAALMGYLDVGYYAGSSGVIYVDGNGKETELAAEIRDDYATIILGAAGHGQIDLTDAKLYSAGPTIIGEQAGSRGQLHILGNSWADLAGSLAVGGTFSGAGGSGLVYLEDDPWNSVYADLTCAPQEGQYVVVWPRGTVRMNGGAISLRYSDDAANAIQLIGGTLEGWGWIWANVENESGVVAPGADSDWKALEIHYHYSQQPSGTLKISIGGTEAYWDYGGLVLPDPNHGNATLDGRLEIQLADGFVPSYDDEFVIIDAQSVVGRFINAHSHYLFQDGRFEVLYEQGRVVLTHFESVPSCPAYPVGDVNQDCAVDLADFAVMACHWLESNLVFNESVSVE